MRTCVFLDTVRQPGAARMHARLDAITEAAAESDGCSFGKDVVGRHDGDHNRVRFFGAWNYSRPVRQPGIAA